MNRAFTSELQMVNTARRVLQRALVGFDGSVSASYEVAGPGAIPDMVLFIEEEGKISYVITVEFKLRNWKKALSQAFKHKNVGNEAYVLLDHAYIAPALANLEHFESANIGLASLDSEGIIHFIHDPVPALPFSEAFSKKLASNLIKPTQKETEAPPFTTSFRAGRKLSRLRRGKLYMKEVFPTI